jgi:hypothetical protein
MLRLIQDKRGWDGGRRFILVHTRMRSDDMDTRCTILKYEERRNVYRPHFRSALQIRKQNEPVRSTLSSTGKCKWNLNQVPMSTDDTREHNMVGAEPCERLLEWKVKRLAGCLSCCKMENQQRQAGSVSAPYATLVILTIYLISSPPRHPQPQQYLHSQNRMESNRHDICQAPSMKMQGMLNHSVPQIR